MLLAEGYLERLTSLLEDLQSCEQQCRFLSEDDKVFNAQEQAFLMAANNRLIATQQLVQGLQVVAWVLDHEASIDQAYSKGFLTFLKAFARKFKAYINGEITLNKLKNFLERRLNFLPLEEDDVFHVDVLMALIQGLHVQQRNGEAINVAEQGVFPQNVNNTQNIEIAEDVQQVGPLVGPDVEAFALYFQNQVVRRSVQVDVLMRRLVQHVAQVPFLMHIELARACVLHRPPQYIVEQTGEHELFFQEDEPGNIDEFEGPGEDDDPYPLGSLYNAMQDWLQVFYGLVEMTMPSHDSIRLNPLCLENTFEEPLVTTPMGRLPSPRGSGFSPETIFEVAESPTLRGLENMGLGNYYGGPGHRRVISVGEGISYL
ncbi:MAG: hypothetical protein Tsb0018_01450 [Opitutales bacterium]